MSLSSVERQVQISTWTRQLMIAAVESGYAPLSKGLLFGVFI
jgi:hypothetical protein